MAAYTKNKPNEHLSALSGKTSGRDPEILGQARPQHPRRRKPDLRRDGHRHRPFLGLRLPGRQHIRDRHRPHPRGLHPRERDGPGEPLRLRRPLHQRRALEEDGSREDARPQGGLRRGQLGRPPVPRREDLRRGRPLGRTLRREVPERLRPGRRELPHRQLGRPLHHQLHLRLHRRPEGRDAHLPQLLLHRGLQPASRPGRRQDGVDASDGPHVRPRDRVHLSAVQRHVHLLAGQGPDPGGPCATARPSTGWARPRPRRP